MKARVAALCLAWAAGAWAQSTDGMVVNQRTDACSGQLLITRWVGKDAPSGTLLVTADEKTTTHAIRATEVPYTVENSQLRASIPYQRGKIGVIITLTLRAKDNPELVVAGIENLQGNPNCPEPTRFPPEEPPMEVNIVKLTPGPVDRDNSKVTIEVFTSSAGEIEVLAGGTIIGAFPIRQEGTHRIEVTAPNDTSSILVRDKKLKNGDTRNITLPIDNGFGWSGLIGVWVLVGMVIAIGLWQRDWLQRKLVLAIGRQTPREIEPEIRRPTELGGTGEKDSVSNVPDTPGPAVPSGEAMQLHRRITRLDNQIVELRGLIKGTPTADSTAVTQPPPLQEGWINQAFDRIQALERSISGVESWSPASKVAETKRTPEGMSKPEAKLIACVNLWLEEGAMSRDRLSVLARDAGLVTTFRNFFNINESLNKLSESKFSFEESANDGGWIWLRAGNIDEYFALPFDRALVTGQVAILAQKMFLGLDQTTGPIAFEKFYRACRFQLAPGESDRWLVVTQGVVQLQGAPSPELSDPPKYADVLRGSEGAAIGRESLATKLKALEGRLSSDLEELKARTDQAYQDLGKEITDAFEKIEKIEKKIDAEKQSREQQRRDLDAKIEGLRKALETVQDEVLLRTAHTEEAEKAMAAAAGSQPTSAPSGPEPVATPPPLPEVEPEPAQPPPPLAANGDWWDIPVRGTTASDSKGYRDALLESLRVIPPDAKLVKLRMDGSLVEVADLKVDEKKMILIGPHGELGNREYYQTFLAQQAGDRLQVAMPRCRFNIDNSPTVLAALVESHPTEPKQIESVERPAELIRDRNGKYKIQTRMKLRFTT